MTATKDLFSMDQVDPASKPTGTPNPMVSKVQTGGRDLSKYKVRIERFVVDDMSDDLNTMESLLSRCLDPKDDTAWLLERKDNFSKEGIFISIVFYLERKPE